jgi:hypothetical protein
VRAITWAIAATLPLSACDAGPQRIAGPYTLQPVEQNTQLIVVYDQGGGNYISRVEETVFAVGADDRYVVAARHPHEPGYSPLDKTVTEYFYIDRARDQPLADPTLAVVGPMDAASFQAASHTLGLPKLSREIARFK